MMPGDKFQVFYSITGNTIPHPLGPWDKAEERGDKDKAEKLYAKSGFWRDRYNRLKGDA